MSNKRNRRKNVPNGITIDATTVTDLPSIKPLLLELMDAMADTEGFNVEQSIENCRILIKEPAHHILVAREKDSILGFVSFITTRTIMHPRPSGLIDELIVTGRSRGLGIGKQLILAAINECREIGCCEVEVSTEKSNAKARQFYKACGFKEDAVLLEIDLEK
jgi:GNAT superfamily N-acetyltransferase